MDFYDLAPLHLRSRRVRRYLGDDLCMPLSAFAASDQGTIRWLYGVLQELFAAVAGPGPAGGTVREVLARESVEEIVTRVHGLGSETVQGGVSGQMAKVLHDIRGGGLTSLLGHLQLAELRGGEPSEALYFLLRDHLKIMRNALLELDDAKRAEDLRPKPHSTDFIVEKWSGARIHHGPQEATLDVRCPLRANISECCVEFGALDRILYNLLNNACRHAAADRIGLTILPVTPERAETLRFVVTNALRAEDERHLAGHDLGALFEAGVSTTGSGYGLNVAAEFVANAFGLDGPRSAVAGGYLGARCAAGEFIAWFHWPTLGD